MDCMLGGLEEIKNMVKRNHGKETFCRHKTDGKTRKGKIVFLRAMANKGTSIIQSPLIPSLLYRLILLYHLIIQKEKTGI